MKKLLGMLSVATLLVTGSAVAKDSQSESHADTTVLSGEYHWTARDMKGPVKATFTPAGDGKWSVDFNFTFRDRPHTYSGMAEGSLDSGSLKGEVQNEDKKRTFTFDGSVSDGTFTATHQEIREDGIRDTGTITLELRGE